MVLIQRLALVCLAVTGVPSMADAQSISLRDLAEAQCVYVMTLNGTAHRSGPRCPEDISRVRDCIVLDVPGNRQRVPGIGVVRAGEPVRIGPDCEDDLPVGRVVGAPPGITDETAPWMNADANNAFTARLDPGENHTIDAVYLRQSRHYWPGRDVAHYIPATVLADGETYTAQPAMTGTWLKADHVFYEWIVEYTSDVTGESGQARSTSGATPHGFVYQCTADQQALTLSQIVALTGVFSDDPRDNPGYPVPSHIIPSVSLKNQGMPYATGKAVLELTTVSMSSPTLLQFEPGHPDESDERRYSQARLIGLGYGRLYTTGARRPVMGCIPSSAWFVHEAGWHRTDGGMTVFQVEEAFPGQMPGPLVAVGAGVFHPRLWDVHVWLPVDGAAATLSLDSPFPIEGMLMSKRAFFMPETFE